MLSVLQLIGAFVADLFKSRRRLEIEKLFLRHQLNIALRRMPHRLRLRGSDRALMVWMTWLWPGLLERGRGCADCGKGCDRKRRDGRTAHPNCTFNPLRWHHSRTCNAETARVRLACRRRGSGVAAEVKRAHPANSSGVLVRRD